MPDLHPTNFVIAISSVSGGGKTSLVKKTAELLNGATLLFDEYKTVSQYPQDMRATDELARQLVAAVENARKE